MMPLFPIIDQLWTFVLTLRNVNALVHNPTNSARAINNTNNSNSHQHPTIRQPTTQSTLANIGPPIPPQHAHEAPLHPVTSITITSPPPLPRSLPLLPLTHTLSITSQIAHCTAHMPLHRTIIDHFQPQHQVTCYPSPQSCQNYPDSIWE